MSAPKARLGGRVQLVQCDMRLAINMARMAKGGFSHAAIEETQYRMKKLHAEVRDEKKQGVEIYGCERRRLRYNDARLCFIQTKQTDAFLAKMARQSICSHPGGAKERVHLRLADTDSLHQIRCHSRQEYHLSQPVRPREHKGPKVTIYHPEMCINTLHFPNVQFVYLDVYTQDGQHDTDYNPVMLPDGGTSTG